MASTREIKLALKEIRKYHNKIVILPLCPFAAAVFKKRTDYKDVLG